MLRLSDPKVEGPYQVSHPLKFPLFLSPSEMEKLLEELGNPLIAQTARVVDHDALYVTKEVFIEAYGRYISGKVEEGDLAILSSVMTVSGDALYAIQREGSKVLVRPCKPVLQLHLFHFTLSHDRKECIQMAHGKGAIPWGIELVFPTRYRDPQTVKDYDVLKEEQFVNRNLCKKLQKWVRKNTMPTPLVIDGMRKNETFRMGKEMVNTINTYPPLVEQGLKVAVLHD